MRELIAHFLDHIAYERGLSANTRAAYETDLVAFAAFLEAQGHLTAFSQVTRDHIAEFLADQRRKRMSTATLARRLVAIKVFFAFLCAEGRIDANVTEAMASPNKGRVLPHTVSESEIARLLNSIDGGSPHDVRDRCMLELFYACGLRVSEVTALSLGDVRLEEGVVRCVGKGDKQRVVPLGSEARRWLERYVAQARPAFARGRDVEQGTLSDAAGHAVHAAGRLRDAGEACACRATLRGAFTACVAALFREPPVGARREYPRDSRDARTRRHRHDTDLHARR